MKSYVYFTFRDIVDRFDDIGVKLSDAEVDLMAMLLFQPAAKWPGDCEQQQTMFEFLQEEIKVHKLQNIAGLISHMNRKQRNHEERIKYWMTLSDDELDAEAAVYRVKLQLLADSHRTK